MDDYEGVIETLGILAVLQGLEQFERSLVALGGKLTLTRAVVDSFGFRLKPQSRYRQQRNGRLVSCNRQVARGYRYG